MRFLKDILSEDNGNFSSMRLTQLMIIIGMFINLIITNYTTEGPVFFSWEEIVLILGVVWGKAFQKWFEKGKDLLQDNPKLKEIALGLLKEKKDE